MNALTVQNQNLMETEKLAHHFVQSGFFPDIKSLSQAVSKIVIGQSLGLNPFESLQGLYIVKGRPCLSANTMAAAIKKSGRYNYEVKELTNEVATIEFYGKGGKFLGESSFTLADAKKANLQGQNWQAFTRNMLFARALSNGYRWYCPDAMGASAVYEVSEMSDVAYDVDGDVIEVKPSEGNGKQSERPAISGNGNAPAVNANGNGKQSEPTLDEKIAFFFEQVEKAFGFSQDSATELLKKANLWPYNPDNPDSTDHYFNLLKAKYEDAKAVFFGQILHDFGLARKEAGKLLLTNGIKEFKVNEVDKYFQIFEKKFPKVDDLFNEDVNERESEFS